MLPPNATGSFILEKSPPVKAGAGSFLGRLVLSAFGPLPFRGVGWRGVPFEEQFGGPAARGGGEGGDGDMAGRGLPEIIFVILGPSKARQDDGRRAVDVHREIVPEPYAEGECRVVGVPGHRPGERPPPVRGRVGMEIGDGRKSGRWFLPVAEPVRDCKKINTASSYFVGTRFRDFFAPTTGRKNAVAPFLLV